jgi:Leucine-rich repeat (LRR) protein
MIPPGVFSELRTLETLDMRGNSLQTIDALVLPPRLQHLSLADNMIYTMPVIFFNFCYFI